MIGLDASSGAVNLLNRAPHYTLRHIKPVSHLKQVKLKLGERLGNPTSRPPANLSYGSQGLLFTLIFILFKTEPFSPPHLQLCSLFGWASLWASYPVNYTLRILTFPERDASILGDRSPLEVEMNAMRCCCFACFLPQ